MCTGDGVTIHKRAEVVEIRQHDVAALDGTALIAGLALDARLDFLGELCGCDASVIHIELDAEVVVRIMRARNHDAAARTVIVGDRPRERRSWGKPIGNHRGKTVPREHAADKAGEALRFRAGIVRNIHNSPRSGARPDARGRIGYTYDILLGEILVETRFPSIALYMYDRAHGARTPYGCGSSRSGNAGG